jgi:RNA polymerase sigma factor (sigma-70 family)
MTSEVVRRLRRVVPAADGGGRTDEQLLHDYLGGADDTALDALVRRHAPMVWGVCRRVAGAGPDAEDAFQAAFLVFVRRAGSIGSPHLLGNWLYGVAQRTAFKARSATGRRRAREADLADAAEPPAPPPGPWDEALPLLDEELARLPDRYRVALVLCDLQGKTRREAAELLRAPAGTVAAWVARGRALLAARLARRGVGLPCGAAALLARDAAARVPAPLLNTAPFAPRGAVSPRAAALSERVTNAMLLTRLTTATTRLLALAAGLALTAVAAATVAGQNPTPPPRPTAPPAPAAAPPPAAAGWREAFVLWHDHPLSALACAPGLLAAGDAGGNLYLCDPLTGKNRVRKLRGAKEGTLNALRDYDQLAFTPDAKMLFFIRGAGGSVMFTRPGDDDEKAWGLGGGGTPFLALAPDAGAWVEKHGKTVLVRPNPYLHESQKERDEFSSARYESEPVRAALSPPDGTLLAALSADGNLRVHDRSARGDDELAAPVATVALGKREVVALQFSAKGDQLAVVGADGLARVYEAKTGKELVALKGHGGIVFCAAFSPDGQLLATGGDDHLVRVWDAATGRLRAVLTGHTDSVRAATFDPSGRVLLTASADRTVRAWTPPR